MSSIGEDEFLPLAELLDDAEHVVPAPGVQAGAVIAELIEHFLHLERERQHLDEHRRLDLSATEIELVFSPVEDVVP